MDNDLVIKEFLLYIKDHYSERTLNSYSIDIYQLFNYMQQEGISEFRQGIKYFESHLETLNIKSRTKQRKKCVLRKFISWLGITDVKVNLLSSVEKRDKNESMAHEEIDQFLSTLSALPNDRINLAVIRDTCIFEIMLACNLNLSEIIDLRVADLHVEGYFLEINATYYPILVEKTRTVLTEYLDIRNQFHPKCDYLFLNKYGEKISYGHLNQLFRHNCKIAGLTKTYTPKSMMEGADKEYFSKGVNFRLYKNFLSQIK